MEHFINEEQKLVNTIDIIQKRFWCNIEELIVWRNALLLRYSAITDQMFSLQIIDFDTHDNIIANPGAKLIDKVPSNLFKTTIRLFWYASKRITVTLYFKTASNGGTLLCQGKDCLLWNTEECENLKDIVSSFIENSDYETFTASLIEVPLCFVVPCNTVSLAMPELPMYRETEGEPVYGTFTEHSLNAATSSTPNSPAVELVPPVHPDLHQDSVSDYEDQAPVDVRGSLPSILTPVAEIVPGDRGPMLLTLQHQPINAADSLPFHASDVVLSPDALDPSLHSHDQHLPINAATPPPNHAPVTMTVQSPDARGPTLLIRQPQPINAAENTPIHAPDAVTNQPPDPSGSLLLSCQYQPISSVVLHAPTPPIVYDTSHSHSPNKQPQSQTKATRTPSGVRAKQLRRRTLCFTKSHAHRHRTAPVSLPKSAIAEFEVLKESVDDLFISQQDIRESMISTAELIKTSVKNELKVAFNSKWDDINEKTDRLKSEMYEWVNKFEVLKKELQSVKTQLGNVRSDLKSIKAVVPVSTQNTQSQTEYTNSFSVCMNPPISYPECRPITNGTNTHELSDSNRLELAAKAPESPPFTGSHTTESVAIKRSSVEKSPNLLASCKSPEKFETDCIFPQRTNATLFSDKSQHLTSPPVALESCYSIPVNNSFSPLSNDNVQPSTTQDKDKKSLNESSKVNKEETSGRANEMDHNEDNVRPTPFDKLRNMKVNARTDALLIGDSVVRYVNTQRLGIRQLNLSKICIPGMCTNDLYRWLESQHPHPNIKALVVHVGLNDCPSGPVPEDFWRDLISQCEHVFPNANIAFSSVIPAKGRMNINNAIIPTNTSMERACERAGVTFINNTSNFVANSGAPKLSMYHDAVHPNQRGVAQLASSIKRTILGWIQSERTHYGRRNQPHASKTEDEHVLYAAKPHREVGYSRYETPESENYHSAYTRDYGHNNRFKALANENYHESHTRDYSHGGFPNNVHVRNRSERSGLQFNREANSFNIPDPGPPSMSSMTHFPGPPAREYNAQQATNAQPQPATTQEGNSVMYGRVSDAAGVRHQLSHQWQSQQEMHRYMQFMNVMAARYWNNQHYELRAHLHGHNSNVFV